jgi:hypothetical protein
MLHFVLRKMTWNKNELNYGLTPFMSLKWVAQALQMGSWTYVSNLLNGRAKPLSLFK